MGLYEEATKRIAAHNREVTRVQIRWLEVSLIAALAAGYTPLGLGRALVYFGIITIFVVVMGFGVKSEYEHEQVREGTKEAWHGVIRKIHDNNR